VICAFFARRLTPVPVAGGHLRRVAPGPAAGRVGHRPPRNQPHQQAPGAPVVPEGTGWLCGV